MGLAKIYYRRGLSVKRELDRSPEYGKIEKFHLMVICTKSTYYAMLGFSKKKIGGKKQQVFPLKTPHHS